MSEHRELARAREEHELDDFRPCVVIPTYNNPTTVGEVARIAARQVPVIVVDDGSEVAGERAVQILAEEGIAFTHRRSENGGKGAAVQDGFRLATQLGYSHALQVDADGQHALEDLPRFLDIANKKPDAVILGAPLYDESAPLGRLLGRKITVFWTHIETGRRVIDDPMCGFRVYPLRWVNQVANDCGRRMDFDIEIAVRLVWEGAEIINLPTRVHYPENGVSNFRMVSDNLLISWAHTRLVVEGLGRWIFRRKKRALSSGDKVSFDERGGSQNR